MNHAGTVPIETERLLLRPLRVEDAEKMYTGWASDPEVVKYLTWPVHSGPEVTRELLALWVSEYARQDYYNWVLEEKSSGALMGNISVVHSDEAISSLELGYCIGSKWWGKGFMPEAGKAVVHYLFTQTSCQRISARHDVNNPNSGKVMRKLGMTCEGTLRRSARNNRGIVDMVCFSILRDEYKGDRKSVV